MTNLSSVYTELVKPQLFMARLQFNTQKDLSDTMA
jgi:hypothetical protein